MVTLISVIFVSIEFDRYAIDLLNPLQKKGKKYKMIKNKTKKTIEFFWIN